MPTERSKRLEKVSEAAPNDGPGQDELRDRVQRLKRKYHIEVQVPGTQGVATGRNDDEPWRQLGEQRGSDAAQVGEMIVVEPWLKRRKTVRFRETSTERDGSQSKEAGQQMQSEKYRKHLLQLDSRLRQWIRKSDDQHESRNQEEIRRRLIGDDSNWVEKEISNRRYDEFKKLRERYKEIMGKEKIARKVIKDFKDLRGRSRDNNELFAFYTKPIVEQRAALRVCQRDCATLISDWDKWKKHENGS